MATVLSAGCDRPRPTEPRAVSSALAAKAVSGAALADDQSYDVVIESAIEGLPSQKHDYHVERHRTGAGWKTHIAKRPDERLAGTGDASHQLASLDIDEEGNQTASDATGRRFPNEPTAKLRDASERARAGYSPELKSRSNTRSMQRPLRRPGEQPVFDIVDNIVKSRDEHRAKMAGLRARLGAPHVDALGREHYSRPDRGAVVDIVADPKRAVITDMTRTETGGQPERVHFDYVDIGNRMIRTHAKYSRPKTARDAGSSQTVTISHIIVNGKEITP